MKEPKCNACRVILMFTLLVGIAVALTSCQSTPTVDEINDQYDHFKNVIDQYYEDMKKACQNHSDPQGCMDAVTAWYIQALQLLNEAHQKAIEENWKDAKERRKELEEWLRETIKDLLDELFPNINDILSPLLMSGEIHFDLTIEDDEVDRDRCLEVVDVVNIFREDYENIDLNQDRELLDLVDQNPCFIGVLQEDGRMVARALEATAWVISGSVTYWEDGVTVTSSVDGQLDLAKDVSVPGGTHWNVISGVVTVTLDDGSSVDMFVTSEEGNSIFTDSTGSGELNILFENHYSSGPWSAVLPFYNRMRLPVDLTTEEAIVIQTGWVAVADLVPHVPWPASDYNGDGVLDFDTDFAAFMDGLNNQEPLADVNNDGLWNDDDIDLWISRFWEDYHATQP